MKIWKMLIHHHWWIRNKTDSTKLKNRRKKHIQGNKLKQLDSV